MTAYILDTEAHDLTAPHATEIAYIKVGFVDGVLAYLDKNAFEQRYNPQKAISLGSMSITGIFDDDVADMPPHTSFELPTDCQILIGHNIDFDVEVLSNAECDMSQIKRVCTLAMSRHFYPNLDTHTLGAMLCHFEPQIAKKNLKHAHGAKYDIWFNFLVLKAICREQGIDTMDKLVEIAEVARIPTVMGFGKHKGVAIKDLPSDYVSWLLKQADLDSYLKLALGNIKS
ncbi:MULTISPECIES: putative quorum-sensing-regulated virulence factor [unclassified Moraxella]|uniref:putative quorum-sensing-regulated virulence factor n=1 Tax=unclassified Moraxella TaxID=2685852 RepID=UPI003AF50C7A